MGDRQMNPGDADLALISCILPGAIDLRASDMDAPQWVYR